MLCFNLFSSVATPISDCSTSWTCLGRSVEAAAEKLGTVAEPLLAPFSLTGGRPRDRLPIRSRWRGASSEGAA